MYKRILVIAPRDCLIPFDYTMSGTDAEKSIGWNSGNNVFWFAIQKMLITEDVQSKCKSLSYVNAHSDEVNAEYDACVFCPANLLNPDFGDIIKCYVEVLRKVKIPTFVLGIGAQTSFDYDKSFLSTIKDSVMSFMITVLKTGGMVECRGNFTGQCLKDFGFKEGQDYEVLGCPSLFQNGPSLCIANPTNADAIRPCFNGPELLLRPMFKSLYSDFPKSWHISQVCARSLLYRPDEIEYDKWHPYLKNYVMLASLIKEKRLKYFCDVIPWRNALRSQNFNFNIGSRIHGSIMAILSGVPAYVLVKDGRVRELVEYFDIPHAKMPLSVPLKFNLVSRYKDTDYSKFNLHYRERYFAFKSFMNQHGLPWGEDFSYINGRIESIPFTAPPIDRNVDADSFRRQVKTSIKSNRCALIKNRAKKTIVRIGAVFIASKQARKNFRNQFLARG